MNFQHKSTRKFINLLDFILKTVYLGQLLFYFICNKYVYIFDSDFRKLQRDFNINVEPMIANCIDLGVWYNDVVSTSGRWSLARLVAEIVSIYKFISKF